MPARHFAGKPQAVRRKRVWNRQLINQGGISSAGPQQINLLSGIEASGAGGYPLGWTVGPVFLSGVAVRRTSASVTTNESVVAGVTVSSRLIEAVDQDPTTQPMLDWMLFQAFQAPDATTTAQFSIDPAPGSRSMRKLDELNEGLWLVLGTADTGTFTFSCWASVLCIL